MSPHQRSESIKDAAVELGFDRCGIATAGPIPRGDLLADWLAKGHAGTMHYLHRHQASRADVRAWLPWARSIIVVALNYYQKPELSEPAPRTKKAPTHKDPTDPKLSRHPQSSSPANPAFGHGAPSNHPTNPTFSRDPKGSAPPNSPQARIAMYACGDDYHVVLRDKLEHLLDRMHRLFSKPFQSRICVDTSAILERELAAAAGIGWIGRNTMVIHPKLGSFFVLGEIITDLQLDPDTPEPNHCGTCTRCLEACPTGAFPQPYVMDATRCISYLTIEHRGEIEPALAAKMGNWVFGCDICQDVCPFNRRVPVTTESRFKADPDDTPPHLEDIISWDQAAYESHVQGKATNRATLPMWHRNAHIAQRNTRRSNPPR